MLLETEAPPIMCRASAGTEQRSLRQGAALHPGREGEGTVADTADSRQLRESSAPRGADRVHLCQGVILVCVRAKGR